MWKNDLWFMCIFYNYVLSCAKLRLSSSNNAQTPLLLHYVDLLWICWTAISWIFFFRPRFGLIVDLLYTFHCGDLSCSDESKRVESVRKRA